MLDRIDQATRIVDLRSDGTSQKEDAILLETKSLKLARIQLAANRETETHEATGEVLIECRSGKVRVTTPCGEAQLEPGQALHLMPYAQHSLYGMSECEVTVATFSEQRPRERVVVKKDIVQEASEESFPASDPPSWTPVNSA